MEYIMKKLISFNCFCCGSELTAPQFYKGNVYGWTCIKKVSPKKKQTKVKDLYIIPFTEVNDTFNNFIPSNTTSMKSSKLDKCGYRFTLTNGKKLFVNASFFFYTIAGINPKAETSRIDNEYFIDYEKQVLIIPSSHFNIDGKIYLAKLGNVQGDFSNIKEYL